MTAAKREKGDRCPTNFFSLSSWNERHSPNGTTKPWSSISYRRESPRIEEFWCAIKPLEKWDIWNREREREDRSLYGVGSRSPVSRKRERHRKKLARIEWYAAAIVPRETVSHIIQLYFYWKMKKEGGRRQAGRQVSPGKRRSPLSQRGYAPIILCLIWFHGLRAATGISSVYSYSCIYGQVDCLSNFLGINDEN